MRGRRQPSIFGSTSLTNGNHHPKLAPPPQELAFGDIGKQTATIPTRAVAHSNPRMRAHAHLPGSSAPSNTLSSERPSMCPGMSTPPMSIMVGARSMFRAMFGTLLKRNTDSGAFDLFGAERNTSLEAPAAVFDFE